MFSSRWNDDVVDVVCVCNSGAIKGEGLADVLCIVVRYFGELAIYPTNPDVITTLSMHLKKITYSSTKWNSSIAQAASNWAPED